MDKTRKRSLIRTPTNISFVSESDLKEYEKSRNSLKGRLQDFCSDTSFTPVSHVYKAGSPGKKVVWVFASLCLTAYMSFQCSKLIINYLKYPSEVGMTLAFSPELDFPSVTVCNLNPLRHSLLERSKYADAFRGLQDDGSEDILYLSAHHSMLPFDHSGESWEDMSSGPEVNFRRKPPKCTSYSGKLSWYCITAQPSDHSLPLRRGRGLKTGPYGTGSTPYYYESDTMDPEGPEGPWGPEEPVGSEEPGGPKEGGGEQTGPPQTNPPSGGGQPGMGPQWSSGTSTAGSTGVFSSRPTAENKGPPSPTAPTLRRRRRAVNGTEQTGSNFTTVISNTSYNQWEFLGDDNADSFYKKKSSQHRAMDMVSDIVATMDPEEVSMLGHQKKDFIMGCKWQGYPCSPRNFTSFVNYKYGNCFTFNAEVTTSNYTANLKTSNPGPLYGLELELFIEQDEYAPSVSQEAGARVVVHTRGKVPFPEDEGFTVSPGFLTSVGMRKTSIIRLGKPHGNCTEKFTGLNSLYEKVNPVYSKQACMKSCYQTTLILRCECGLASYPLPANVSLCEPRHANCSETVKHLYTANELGCDEACPLPCTDEAYTLTISNAVWPGRKYQSDLFSRMMKSSTKLMRSASKNGYKYDVAKVELFYQELNYQLIEQKPSYEFENVISDLGGQLGLWLGVSILALGEILDLLVSVVHFCLFKMTNASQHRPGATPVYPYRPPKE